MALLRLLSGQNRDRYASQVACLYNGGSAVAREIEALGIPVADLKMASKLRWDALGRLYGLLRRARPDILHTWLFHANVPGRLLGRLAGVPIIVSSERAMGIESRGRYLADRATVTLADRVTCVSQSVARFYGDEVRLPRSKLTIIPNGVELPDFATRESKESARARLGLPVGEKLVGTVARLEPVKRLDIMMRAVQSLPDVHAVIIGEGTKYRPMVELRNELGILNRVRFAGRQNNVSEWLAALDLFVLSSDSEGMPNTVLEAMAAGLPVVATAVGGTTEVVADGETGLLVPPRDPQALAQAIQVLLDDPERARAMGRKGRERVAKSFDIRRTVHLTESLYEELLREKRNSISRPPIANL